MEKLTQKISNNKIIFFLILAIFFTLPFERIPTFEMAGFTVKISYVLGVLLLVASTSPFLSLLRRGVKSGMTVSDWFLAAFWIFSLITTLINSTDLTRGLVIVALWDFVFILYLILSRLIKNSDLKEKIEKIVIISSVLVCLFGLYQFIGDSLGLSLAWTQLRPAYAKTILGFPRIQSTGLEPLFFANFLLVPFFLSIKNFIEKKSWQYFTVSTLILINIILSVSRGAYIAVGCTFILFISVLLFSKSFQSYKGSICLLLGIPLISIIISLGLLYGLTGKEATGNAISHSTTVSDNVVVDLSGQPSNRASNYQLALNLFKDAPLFGVGVGNFGVLTTSKENAQKGNYNTANNEYLEILSETGLVGLLLFFSFIVFYLKEAFSGFVQKTDFEKMAILCLFCGLAAIFIQYNFFSTLYIIYIWAFLALLKSYSLEKESRIN